MKKAFLLTAMIGVLAACSAPADPKISVHDGWARETGQAGITAAYVTIQNNGGADRLTGVRAKAGKALLHETSVDGDVVRMRPISPGEGIVVPSNGKLVLNPGGAHVMVSGLERPLEPGDRFDLTLLFDKSRPKKVEIMVRPADESGAAR